MKYYISPKTEVVCSVAVGAVLRVSNNAGLGYSDEGFNPGAAL